MIKIDLGNKTYVCPFCNHAQAFGHSFFRHNTLGQLAERLSAKDVLLKNSFDIFTFQCNNTACGCISVIAISLRDGHQIDLVPRVVMKHYPDYIPQQIRHDYEEANLILEASPKAAATLLRRCLQGMIRDFWRIKEKNLYAAITAIQNMVTPPQWKALDGLRKLGNIGAHMEKDVDLIIDIDPGEAKKLLRLIELLLDKWYLARHEEEALCSDIAIIADEKESQRKTE
ncbi:MAG: DUF4145 domain-containing protein [Kiritimatiellae bacterium]|nr:DUF4145 domain-containing protein [Kiritimatiellia bacterium]